MVYRKEMDKKLIFSGYEPREDSKIFRVSIIMFAIIATLSLIVTGCSSHPPAPAPVPQVPSTENVPTSAVETNTSLDYSNKSEVQKTQDQIAQFIVDGSYDNNVTYNTHVGQETVEIKVTTKGDIVTAASVTPVNADHTSQNYINAFNNALPDLVIGKKITEINIPHTVSGSSLTSAAFKNQLEI